MLVWNIFIYVPAVSICVSSSFISNNSSLSAIYHALHWLTLLQSPIGAEGYDGESDWREIPGEVRAWEAVQASLDVYVQRISVADSSQKSHMRAWYEALQDIGGLYHGSAPYAK